MGNNIEPQVAGRVLRRDWVNNQSADELIEIDTTKENYQIWVYKGGEKTMTFNHHMIASELSRDKVQSHTKKLECDATVGYIEWQMRGKTRDIRYYFRQPNDKVYKLFREKTRRTHPGLKHKLLGIYFDYRTAKERLALIQGIKPDWVLRLQTFPHQFLNQDQHEDLPRETHPQFRLLRELSAEIQRARNAREQENHDEMPGLVSDDESDEMPGLEVDEDI